VFRRVKLIISEKLGGLLFPVLQIGSPRLYPLYAFSNWSPAVHYLASSLVLACPLGLLPWRLPARTSLFLSVMSPPRGALVVLPRPVLVLL